jgi:hypothetical protein
MNIELLGDRLRRIQAIAKRKNYFSSEAQLARKIGYSPQALTYWKANVRKIPRDVIEPLCTVFKIHPEVFLQGTIQVSGIKHYVNWSSTSYFEIIDTKLYEGLSLVEVQNVLKYKEENPNKIFTSVENKELTRV